MGQKLGQHFLEDQDVLKDIASALEIKKGDIVIEIGPGHGELTNYLIAVNPKNLIVIEKDGALADGLEDAWGELKIKVVRGDALKLLPEVVSGLDGKPYKLTGNIPYYITGHLMRVIEELERRPERTVLTIQEEVAERICSAPPKMNLLAASVQFWGDPHITSTISRKSFRPPPEVDSAILLIDPKPAVGDSDKADYYRFIKVLFKQPRKTILNNIRDGSGADKADVESRLKSIRVSPTLRPGNIDINTIVELSRVFRF